VLRGTGSRAEHISIAFAAAGQNQDTGAKVYHLAPRTTSHITSKSIAVEGGVTTYRGLVKIAKGARGAKSAVECDALMVDNVSVSNTYPFIDVKEADSDVGHEATVGRISDEDVFYLMSRGIPEDEAKKLIVNGFLEPVTKELPVEYAVELNRLIELEMEGSLG
jgi:Fe-S cluster assembly protein SufB